jgi:hypothetical protein
VYRTKQRFPLERFHGQHGQFQTHPTKTVSSEVWIVSDACNAVQPRPNFFNFMAADAFFESWHNFASATLTPIQVVPSGFNIKQLDSLNGIIITLISSFLSSNIPYNYPRLKRIRLRICFDFLQSNALFSQN